MSMHIVGLHRPAHIRLSRTIPFRTTRERPVELRLSASGDERREHCLVRCQVGGAAREGIDCQACPRFLEWQDDGVELRVRCAWSDRDRVRDCMTLASALVVTHPRATLREAEQLALDHQVGHLLVVDALSLVGILSCHDLPPEGRVSDLMSREILSVLGEATLGEAAAAMVAFDVGMLPVIGERFVIGAITRVDLIRMGVPPSLLRPLPRTLSEARQLDDTGDEDRAPAADDDSCELSL